MNKGKDRFVCRLLNIKYASYFNLTIWTVFPSKAMRPSRGSFILKSKLKQQGNFYQIVMTNNSPICSQ